MRACAIRSKGVPNVARVRNALSLNQIHSTALEIVSALFTGGGISAMSRTCLWTKASRVYTFIGPPTTNHVMPDTKASSSPVLPVLITRAINSYCDRTIGTLG